MRKIAYILFLFLLFSFTLGVKQVSAAQSIIGVSPQKGTFGKPFSINVTIDGHGDKFNAAQATVTLSANIAIQNLILGDCDFSFLTSPSVQDPSFAGIIFSNYKRECTLYTLSLVPTAKGTGAINFSHASIKRYGDAANVLSTVQNGSYTLTAALKAPTVAGNLTDSHNGLYSLNLNIVDTKNVPITNATVNLTSVSSNKLLRTTTDTNGLAHFANLQEGIYDAVIANNSNNKIDETIINVTGKNHVMTLGISVAENLDTSKLKNAWQILSNHKWTPLLSIGMLLLGIIIGTGIAIFYVTLRRRKT